MGLYDDFPTNGPFLSCLAKSDVIELGRPCTFESVKVANTLSVVKNSSSSPRIYLHNRKKRTDAQDTFRSSLLIFVKIHQFTLESGPGQQ